MALMSLITMLPVHRRGECGCGLPSRALRALPEFLGFFCPVALFGDALGESTAAQFSVPTCCCCCVGSPSTRRHCDASDLSVVLVTLLQPGDKTIPS